jgi:hypothetical protein
VTGLAHSFSMFKAEDHPSSQRLRPSRSHRIDLDELASWLSNNEYAILELRGYYQRIELIEHLRGHFIKDLLINESRFSIPELDSFLVIHVRGGDIFRGRGGSWYFPLPFSYYEEVIADSGLPPLFVGQFDSFYADLLARRFPDALFLESGNYQYIHHILRHSPNLAIALSTFSWTASFLSSVLQKMYFPIAGFFKYFNSSADLPSLLMNDSRVIYYDFPEFVADMASFSGIERLLKADSSCFKRIGSFDQLST